MVKISFKAKIALLSVGLLLLGAALGVTGFFAVTRLLEKPTSQAHTHFHAGFQIYVEGKLQDLSTFKYMHFGKCGASAGTVDYSKVTNRVHLHDNVGDVAHIHVDGVTWGNLLESINFQPARGTNFRFPPKFYLNGALVKDLESIEITSYDVAVFIYGDKQPSTAQIAKRAITRQRILDSEAIVESCGS
jgi:hypothetical protein